ncbi:MAG TPA: WbqC family protein [bacterium]
MIVATYQPFFAPFPGFFAKALLADVLVLLDTVQFPQRTGWLTRNRFKSEQGELWLTIPVRRRGRGLQRIDEVRIVREGSWARKHLLSLKESYRRAPFFPDHLPLLESLFADVPDRLVDLNIPILRHFTERLGCRARVVPLSELGIEAREPELSVAICRTLRATAFLTQRPAAKFVSGDLLSAAGVQLLTFAYHPEIHPQLHGAFIQNLSALDLLSCCGPRAPEVLRGWVRPPAPGQRHAEIRH